MHAGLKRAAAGEVDHEQQRERTDRGLIGERVCECVHERLKVESRVKEANRTGIRLRVRKPGGLEQDRSMPKRILRQRALLVDSLAQSPGPEAPLPIDQVRQ